MKQCSKCKELKDESEFNIKKSNKDNLNKMCKKCQNEYHKEYYYNNKENILKNIHNRYNINKNNNKEEKRKKAREYYSENKEKILKRKREYAKINKEKAKQYSKKYYYLNKNKISKKRQKYNLNNKNKIDNYNKKYHAEHKMEILKRKRDYYRKNSGILKLRRRYLINLLSEDEKAIIREIINEKKRKKLKENYNYKIVNNLRNRLHKGIKGKTKKVNILLGCTVEECKKYLESKFQDGMSWENYGFRGWHIDHIKPCSSFDLTKEEEQKKCFHYTNLQPLWWHENLSKGAKLDWKKEDK